METVQDDAFRYSIKGTTEVEVHGIYVVAFSQIPRQPCELMDEFIFP